MSRPYESRWAWCRTFTGRDPEHSAEFSIRLRRDKHARTCFVQSRAAKGPADRAGRLWILFQEWRANDLADAWVASLGCVYGRSSNPRGYD